MKEKDIVREKFVIGLFAALAIAITGIVLLVLALETSIEAAFDNVSNQIKLIAFVIIVLIGLYFLIRKIVKS